jgi:hypothetical protein
MRNVSLLLAPFAAGALALPAAAAEPTINDLVAQGKFCTATAAAVARACNNETLDDYYIGVGICINESDGRDRTECFTDVKDSLDEATAECAAQRKARWTCARRSARSVTIPSSRRVTSTGTSAI